MRQNSRRSHQSTHNDSTVLNCLHYITITITVFSHLPAIGSYGSILFGNTFGHQNKNTNRE